MKGAGILAALGMVAMSVPALAVPVDWTDWRSGTIGQVNGIVAVGSTPVGVTFTGGYSFFQSAGSTYYWTEGTPPPYTGGNVDNAPPTSDIIALGTGGTATISFSQAVHNPIIGLVSWNGVTGTFSDPIQTVSSGDGYWGNGSFSNVTSNSFTGAGELHGVIRLPGNFSQISFTHTTEGWHGIQVGVESLATPTVPVPMPLALLGTGVAALAVASRRKRN